ncbi:hypothetical protein [Thiobacillus sp.]
MNRDNTFISGGILIHTQGEAGLATTRRDFPVLLASLELDRQVEVHRESLALRFHLKPDVAQEWAPDFDTTRLSQRLDLDSGADVADLEREILVAMLVAGGFRVSKLRRGHFGDPHPAQHRPGCAPDGTRFPHHRGRAP